MNYQEEIDFTPYQETTSFGNGTKQYELLNSLEGDDWANYIGVMSARGLIIGYDQTTDTFTVISTSFGI